MPNAPRAKPSKANTRPDHNGTQRAQFESNKRKIYATQTVCGTCGENVTWTLNDGTLTISGTGAMDNYSKTNNAPWYKNKSSITSVCIESSVTNIGDFAFFNCNNITSVTIPKNVENIGNNVFNSCGRLASVIAEGEVPPTIGTDVFEGVSSALQISVPSENTEVYRGGVGRLQSFHQMVYAKVSLLSTSRLN